MNINIDLKLLKEKNLTPNEYVYLVLAYEDKMCNFDVDLNKLEKLKFVKLVGDKVIIRKYNITQLMTHQEFNTESKSQDKTPVNGFEDSWEKLLELYPKKEGTRALQNKVTALPKFKIALKQDGIDTILKGLNNQLEARKTALKKGDFFDGMQGLSTWLHQKTYLMWLDYNPNDDKPKQRFEKA